MLYAIKGDNYQDKDYNVRLDVRDGKNIVYTKSISVSGLILNEGYDLELDDLILESNKIYTFYFDVDGISSRKDIRYIDKDISINSIKQGDKVLSLVNNEYVATEFKKLRVSVNLDDLSDVDEYYINMSGLDGASNNNYNNNELDFNYFYLKNDTEEYTIKVCNNWKCDKLYAVTKIKIKFSRYQEVENSKMYISNVMQGGKKIEMDEDWKFNINDKQDIKYTIRGENLIDDEIYYFRNGPIEISYLGSELEEGADITYYINLGFQMYFNYYIGDNYYFEDYYYFDGNEYYHNGENGKYINFITSSDDSIKSFTTKLTYNNSDEGIFLVDPGIYINDKILNILIDGVDFEDKNYNMSINVIYKNQSIYTDTKEINGLLLNDNYKYVLSNLSFEKMDNIYNAFYGGDNYYIYVTVDGVTDIKDFYYKYDGEVFCGVYYGEKRLIFTSGSGDVTGDLNGYVVNPQIISNKITLKYYSNSLVESRMYDYEIWYRFGKGYSYLDSDIDVVKKGKISGADLMNNQLSYDFYLNGELDDTYLEEYSLILNYNNSFVYETDVVFKKENIPMIISSKLKFNNKEMVMDNRGYYLVRKGENITFEVSGVGFENNRDYYITVGNATSNEIILENTNLFPTNNKIVVKGSQLNNGYKYTINYDDSMKYRRIFFMVSLEDDGWPLERDTLFLDYVDYNDFIKDLNGYEIKDNIFRFVKKNTSVLDLIDSIELYDDSSLKIYDKTNSNEISTKVGTGMILKLYNHNNNLFDFNIIVRGDINGDGNITVTDLVKVKKHLSDIDLLDGIYEQAGDVTSTGSISITDLVKMAKDVAEIEELD